MKRFSIPSASVALLLTHAALAQNPGGAPPPPAPPPGPPPPAGMAPPPPPGAPMATEAVPPPPAPEYRPRPVELWIGLGGGDAVCDHEKPESQCPVAGATTVALGGGWRLHPRWTLGLEVAAWNYKVRDAWKGTLADSATEVKFSSSYFGLLGRYYWLATPSFDGYLQGGLGAAVVQGHAKDRAGNTYDVSVKGVAYALGVGGDWHLARWFRLGPQALAYLQKSSKVCETSNGGDESCKDATNEQNALPWRIMLVGTFMLGGT